MTIDVDKKRKKEKMMMIIVKKIKKKKKKEKKEEEREEEKKEDDDDDDEEDDDDDDEDEEKKETNKQRKKERKKRRTWKATRTTRMQPLLGLQHEENGCDGGHAGLVEAQFHVNWQPSQVLSQHRTVQERKERKTDRKEERKRGENKEKEELERVRCRGHQQPESTAGHLAMAAAVSARRCSCCGPGVLCGRNQSPAFLLCRSEQKVLRSHGVVDFSCLLS